MRDFSKDHSAVAFNTATLCYNLEGYGAGWPSEQVIDACAARDYGGIVFWVRELGTRAFEIGESARAAGLQVSGLCRAPCFTCREAGSDEEIQARIDLASELGAPVLTIVTGVTQRARWVLKTAGNV